MRLVQFDGAEGVGEGGEHAAGHADGAELLVVADEHEFGAVAGEVDEKIEVSGGEHAGFIDDEDVARSDRPPGGQALVVVHVEELGHGLGGHVGFAAQDVGGGGGVGEADHLVAGTRPGMGPRAAGWSCRCRRVR